MGASPPTPARLTTASTIAQSAQRTAGHKATEKTEDGIDGKHSTAAVGEIEGLVRV